MVEDSVPMFETFCQHYDVATLAADQTHIGQYEEIVRTYASFAARNAPVQPKGALIAPIAIRWRSAGLLALKSIASSEAIGADGGRQLNLIIPMLLQNLHPADEDHLLVLQQLMKATEDAEKEASNRRRSNATARTADEPAEPNSASLSGTADDADRMAEEEVGLLALESLKQIFVANNRIQIRLATASMLRFICTNVPQRRVQTSRSSKSGNAGSWTTTLMETIARWAPVQDRFIIVVTAMETLIRSPIAEENLEQQLVLVTIIGWLLRSNINMIGLSVMDVLLGLIQHILLLLQLGGKGSNVLPHHQQTDAIDLFQDTQDVIDQPSSTSSAEKVGEKEEVLPSTNRQELLTRLRRCIGDLATHIYYSDQISDILTAILLRLKPPPISGISTDVAAIEHPRAAAQAISTSVNLQENPQTDDFFSFGTARVTALKAIKEVLIVANIRTSVSGAAAIGRNRVSVQVWEGTQWLLSDEDRRVRRAYVDALLTWLRLEMSRGDLRVMEDKRKFLKNSAKPAGDGDTWSRLPKRAVSNASQRERPVKPAKSTFLHLLHFTIYQNVLASPDSESELLSLHLLLYTLVDKLGVNAVKTGLPMIMRLQEDINIDDLIPTPTAKINVGSLVHGYLWTLSEKFDLDMSRVGHSIQSEITRRKSHKLWLELVRVPPLPLDQIIAPVKIPMSEKLPLPLVARESLKPFDLRPELVNQIATSYAFTTSPPSSPPSSPGRVFSAPVLSSTGSSSAENNELPSTIKEAMLSAWSKDICRATVAKETARTVSLNGSRTGTGLSARQKYLAPTGFSTRNGSPTGAQSPQVFLSNGEGNQTSQNPTINFAFHTQDRLRRSSAQDTDSPTPASNSDQHQTLRVDDLKRVLAGGSLAGVFSKTRGASPLRNSTVRRDFVDDDGRSISASSKSIVSGEGYESASEGEMFHALASEAPVSNNHHESNGENANDAANGYQRMLPSQPYFRDSDTTRPQTQRSTLRPPSSSNSATEDPAANAKALRGDLVPPVNSGETADEEVPPVPPLPAGVTMQKGGNANIGGYGGDSKVGQGARGTRSRRTKGVDVGALLGSIDAVAGEGVKAGGQPPY